MECNKEDASRAKAIAEKKLQDKDFVGARKFALKAQQLYPETENISQLISVCDVHCSAENKVFGNESDWYGILQIEQTADDTMIKKQYRKFALALHPDKNKFSGAESAFKLIGEAQKVLLDREKRSLYDMKRRSMLKPVTPNQTSQQSSKGFNGTKISRVQSTFMSSHNSNAKGFNTPMQETKQQAQSGASNGKETFWTQCPFCLVRYQYYKEVLHRALRCQSCKKPFIAHDMHDHATRPGPNATQPVFPQKNGSNTRTSKAGSEAVNQKPASNSVSHSEQNGKISQETKQSDKSSNHVQGELEKESQPFGKANGKRGKKEVVESNECFASDSSSEKILSDGDTPKAQQFENVEDSHTRQSSRNKRDVSDNEIASNDDETINPSKRAKGSKSSTPLTENKADASGNGQASDTSKLFGTGSASVNEGRKGDFKSSDASETVVESIKKNFDAENGCASDSSPGTTPEPTFHEYPDPDFSDFDKDREECCFKVGQVWAAYDTVDAMPRFYARIKKVFSPGFKLKITWLEPDPDGEDGIKWAKSELPFSCGKFKFGDSENTEDRLMFSHAVCWEKGTGRDSIKIYPKKGETWALFKNWNAKWYEIPENERKFEYEFAEVISEYDETVGIRVAHLGKLKGFASLFCRVGGNEVQIPPTEVLRFAHRVPSYMMTGNERKDVPKGSFELDPASTTRLEEISLPNLDQKNCVNDLSSKFTEANHSAKTAEKSSLSCHNDEEDNQMEHVNHPDVNVNSEELPDPEFYNFDGLKSVDKFKVNQVWALYSDMDGMPNYYGLIKKVESHPIFKLQIAWLEAYLPTDMISWKDKDMPISCGQFKVKGGNVQRYTCNSSFSHQVSADHTTRKNVFTIYPRAGEIWATYKNWHSEMTCLSLIDCEYDIVEVLEENSSYIKVSVLERVPGFNSVFKPKMNSNSSLTRDIPRIESLRFSHEIPSFKLTEERDGSLRGYWELDPAALPSCVLCRN